MFIKKNKIERNLLLNHKLILIHAFEVFSRPEKKSYERRRKKSSYINGENKASAYKSGTCYFKNSTLPSDDH